MAQPVLDRLIDSLRNVKNPVLASIFGLQKHFLESAPETQLAIMKKAERKVYGEAGIEAYEASEPPELARLARRSLAQFLCQLEEQDRGWTKVVWWVGMLVSLGPLAVYLTIRSLADRKHPVPGEARTADVVIYLKKERVRSMLCGVFPGRKLYVHTLDSVHLGLSEWSYFFRTIAACPRILLHPKLLVNILRWLAGYGYMVHNFSPKAIAFYFELVASSSLITGYLHENGTRHFNVTHGERVFCAHGAFCEFDEDYVWGRHFVEIALKLKEKSAFVVRGGEAHTELFEKFRVVNQPRRKRLLITHNPFLSADGVDFDVMAKIVGLLDASWEVAIRRHPIWSTSYANYLAALRSNDLVRRSRVEIIEEPPDTISLKEALAQSRVVVGGSSTALIEAVIAGCKVIYLAGVAHPSTILDRHQGSENIFYATPTSDGMTIARFLQAPAILSREEDLRVNFLAQVTPTFEQGEVNGI